MDSLKYTVIKTRKQYNEYCALLENMLTAKKPGKAKKEEAELLTLLIEKWDADHNTFADHDPVRVLKGLMDEHNIRGIELAAIVDKSKGLISDILNYKKGFSKEIIRVLANYFKVDQEAFNRPYTLQAAHVTVPRPINRRHTPSTPVRRAAARK